MKRNIGAAAIAPEPARRDARPSHERPPERFLAAEPEMRGDPLSLLAPGPVQSGIFNDPFGAAHDRPEVQGFVDTMRAMLNAHGLTPDAFAAQVFDGIRDGRYWLIPQPETIDGALQRRTADILAARDPSLPAL